MIEMQDRIFKPFRYGTGGRQRCSAWKRARTKEEVVGSEARVMLDLVRLLEGDTMGMF